MSESRREYRFVIDAHTPDTLPMARLAEYMADLARLFGEVEHVHFGRVEPGSAILVPFVDAVAVPRVEDRFCAIKGEDPPEDAARACKALNQRLADDNAAGSLEDADGAEIVPFPGRDQPQFLAYGAMTQRGKLDGVLIRVGGRDDTVPVHLQDGDTIHVCNADRDMARRLAGHLYGGVLRVYGDGRWDRDTEGIWTMKRFTITDFEELDDAPLEEVVERLHRIEGSNWKDIHDPPAELRRLRGSDEPD